MILISFTNKNKKADADMISYLLSFEDIALPLPLHWYFDLNAL